MPRYAALLRGINLGGRRIKMDELRAAFEAIGYPGAQTLLASGNVVFDSDEGNADNVRAGVEAGLKERFGIDIAVILRSSEQIKALVSADPAQGVEADKDTKLHVTFLGKPLSGEVELPYKSSEPHFEVRKIDPLHLFDIVHLGPNTGTLNLMDYIEKTLGEGITTRTWNTVVKIAAKLEEA